MATQYQRLQGAKARGKQITAKARFKCHQIQQAKTLEDLVPKPKPKRVAKETPKQVIERVLLDNWVEAEELLALASIDREALSGILRELRSDGLIVNFHSEEGKVLYHAEFCIASITRSCQPDHDNE